MNHSKKISINFSTHTGVTRTVNEDRYGLWEIDPQNNQVIELKEAKQYQRNKNYIYVLAVADGMGGTDKGEYAANKVIFLLRELLNRIKLSHDNLIAELRDFFANANERLLEDKALFKDAVSFGTTLSIALIKEEQLDLFWIGDSRIYLFAKKLSLLIDEHTVVWDLYKSKQIKRKDIWDHPESYIITKCLGLNAREIEPGYKKLKLKGNQRLMICSDGINSMMPDAVIEDVFKNNFDTKTTVDLLIEIANEAGGLDNSTIILFDNALEYSFRKPVLIKEKALLKIRNAKERKPSIIPKKAMMIVSSLMLLLLAIFFFIKSTSSIDCVESTLSELNNAIETPTITIKSKKEIANDLDKLVVCLKTSEIKQSHDINLILKDISRLKTNLISYEIDAAVDVGSYSQHDMLKSELINIEKSIKYIHENK